MDPDELLSKDRSAESPIGEARVFLLELLGNGDKRDATEIMDIAKIEGIAVRTLKRAKGELGIKSKEVALDSGKKKWVWFLPEYLIKKKEDPEEKSGTVAPCPSVSVFLSGCQSATILRHGGGAQMGFGKEEMDRGNSNIRNGVG